MSNESILTISGMTCAACVQRVDRALRAVAGVSDAHIDLETGRAIVQHAEGPGRADELAAAVTRAGYPAVAQTGASS